MTHLEMVTAIADAQRIAACLTMAQTLRLYATDDLHQRGADGATLEAKAILAELTALMDSGLPFKNEPNPQAKTEAVDAYAFADRDSLAAAINLGQRASGCDDTGK